MRVKNATTTVREISAFEAALRHAIQAALEVPQELDNTLADRSSDVIKAASTIN